MTIAISADLAGELARSQSIGTSKMQVVTIATVSGDTGATITADQLIRIDQVLVCGGPVTLTAAPTYSGNTATLAYTDPVANRFLQILCLGK